MKISDLFEGGSTEAQKRKRTVFYTICITLALLMIMLTVLAAIGISNLIAQKIESAEKTAENQISIQNTVSLSLDEQDIYRGSLLVLNGTTPYKGEDTALTFRGREGRPKTDTGSNVYIILSSTSSEEQDFRATAQTIDAFNAMMKDFYTEKKDDNICIVNAYSQAKKDLIDPIYSSAQTVELEYYFDYDSDPNDIRSIHGVDKYTWIYSNAHKYGFINISSADGSGSGIFRYVGIPHATYIKTKKIDFETYLEQLRAATTEAPLLIKIGKTTYASYFVAATDEHLVPADYEYEVNGNNIDGYIITAAIPTSTTSK
jgi:hypothetical protein